MHSCWRKFLLAAFSFALVAAWAATAQPAIAPGPSQAQMAAAQREQWARNLHDKKIDAAVAQYATDAEFLQPDGSRLRGAAAIRNLYQTIVDNFDSDLVFDSQRV